MKRPAFQMYTGDWLSDPALGKCKPATRGIWADIVCLMERSGSTGVLSGEFEQLSRICRATVQEVELAVEDLRITEAADVTLSNGLVTIINRRMVREAEKAAKSTLRVKTWRERKAAIQHETPLVTPSETPLKHVSATATSSSLAAAAADVTPNATETENETFPETVSVIRSNYPGTDTIAIAAIVRVARTEKPDVSDGELVAALSATHQGRKQRSAMLWTHTLPAFFRTEAQARGSGSNAVPLVCPTCGDVGLCECLKRELEAIRKPAEMVISQYRKSEPMAVSA